MSAKQELAQAFVLLWEYLCAVFGRAVALADGALQAARRAYISART